jgi:uncharacterized coiled-coil protein SlyX
VHLSLKTFLIFIVATQLFSADISWDDIMNEVSDSSSKELNTIIPKDKTHYFKTKREELQEIQEQIKKTDIAIKKEAISGFGATNSTEQNAVILEEIDRISKSMLKLDQRLATLREENQKLNMVVSEILKENDSNYRKSIEDVAILQNETNLLKMQDKKFQEDMTELKVQEYNKRKQLEEVVSSFDERIIKLENQFQNSRKASKTITAQNKEIDEVKKGVFYLAEELKAMREQNNELKNTLIQLIMELKKDK